MTLESITPEMALAENQSIKLCFSNPCLDQWNLELIKTHLIGTLSNNFDYHNWYQEFSRNFGDGAPLFDYLQADDVSSVDPSLRDIINDTGLWFLRNTVSPDILKGYTSTDVREIYPSLTEKYSTIDSELKVKVIRDTIVKITTLPVREASRVFSRLDPRIFSETSKKALIYLAMASHPMYHDIIQTFVRHSREITARKVQAYLFESFNLHESITYSLKHGLAEY